MPRPSAVIDKSLLQEICEQKPEELDALFNALLSRYHFVVPSMLVEEVWVNLANPSPGKSAEVVNNMATCLIRLRDSWVETPLEIAFSELVKGQPCNPLPRPSQKVLNSFSILRADDAQLQKWAKERGKRLKADACLRKQQQAAILDSEEFILVSDAHDFMERVVRKKFAEMLRDSDRKQMLLEKVFGLAFRTRHPEMAKEITTAFDSFTLDTFDRYSATFFCIMTAMVYFYAPLCKMKANGSGEARKILGRGSRDQRNNRNDEQYVQTALLCKRLLTSDEGMTNVMVLFKPHELWRGEAIFIDPNRSLTAQIPVLLI